MRVSRILREPWNGFFHALDDELSGPTELHCFGGFVVAECYGLMRATADVDFIEVRGSVPATALLQKAGKHSSLAKTHHVYLDFVTVATVPENYQDRLIDVFPDEFRNLRIRVFDPHDLALAKLERNQDHDRDDVKALALTQGLDVRTLRERYQTELRPYLGRPEREDLTLKFWEEMIKEVQADPC